MTSSSENGLNPPVGRVLSLVSLLLRIPDGARTFSTPIAEAWRRYRLNADLLEFMAAEGLPTYKAHGTIYFDHFDLLNASGHLGTSPANWMMKRFWPAALNRTAQMNPATYEIGYQMQCPAPGHRGPCRYVLVTPHGGRVLRIVDAGDTSVVERARVSLATVWPTLPPELCELLDASSGDLTFMFLPYSLATDLDFIRTTKLADCAAASRLLFQEGQQRGLPARLSYGLAVAPPFSIRHYWVEFQVGEIWVPVDPLLIKTMIGWGVLKSDVWHPHRSLGAILARIAPHRVALARHAGLEVRVTLPTRQVEAALPGPG
jgi:hypothetical protein